MQAVSPAIMAPRRTPKASARDTAGFFARHDNIAAYVPNLIGYARIFLAVYAFAVAFSQPVHCLLAYGLSFVCDELDGRFARQLNQESTLGKVLDMLTDRTATAGLLVIVAVRYPGYYMLPLLLIWLDIFSHWAQMYSTLVNGATTHKDVKSRSPLVRLYYTSRTFMGYCCISCEVLYMMASRRCSPTARRLWASGKAFCFALDPTLPRTPLCRSTC